MIKIYMIEEKGRSLTLEVQNKILECCSRCFGSEQLDYSGGYKYNESEYLLEAIEQDSHKEFEAQGIAFLHSEGEQLLVCAGMEFDAFVNMAKGKASGSVSEILKKIWSDL